MIEPRSVLDASALIAHIRREPGYLMVESAMADGATISLVNYAEVLARLGDAGQDADAVDRRLRDEGMIGGLLRFEPFLEADALTSARLRGATRSRGLSLGDRACLALALRLGLPALTTDRAWAALAVGVDVQVIR